MKQKRTFVGLNLSVFMMMLGVGMIMSLLPNKVIEFTGSSTSVGYIASAFALSYIVLQVPIGNLSDRFGFKIFLMGGYLLCSLTGLLYFFSDSQSLILIGRIFQGAGEAPIWAIAPALLSVKYPDSKGKVMGIYNATLHIGLTIGPILGIFLLKIWSSDAAFLFYTIACFLGAAITYCSVEKAKEKKTVNANAMNIHNILSLTADKAILAVLFGITLYGAGYGLFLTIIPAFLLSVKGFSQTYVQVFFSLFYLAISISQIVTGPLSDKWGRKRFMMVGLLLSALCIGVFPYLSQNLLNAFLMLASLGLGVFYLSSMAFLNNAVPDSLKGTISGAYYLFWGIGFLLGPILIGKLGELPGNVVGFYVYSAALLLETLAMLFLFRKQRGKAD